MADRSPIKNSVLKHAVSLKELTESELRGVGNMGFSDIYEELGDTSNDQENGLFMVENPQFNKQQNQEYLSEVRTVISLESDIYLQLMWQDHSNGYISIDLNV